MRIFNPKIPLRTKLVVPFVFVAVIPLVLVMGITIQNLQKLERENALNLQQVLAREAAEEIQGFVDFQFEVLKNIGTIHPEFTQDSTIRGVLLERFLHRSSSFVDIALLDGTGYEVDRKNLVEVVTTENLVDRSQTQEFLSIVQNGIYRGPVYISKGRPFFILGREIRGTDNVFQGAVVAQVDARIFQDVVRRISL
ncbi:cache domain-containing protein, partial [Patescibacteria group bacterium]|nr:cache domain-containing protein [Patescibacteria group bacterium]